MFFAACFPRLSPVSREMQLNKSNRTDNMGKRRGEPHCGWAMPA